MKEQRVNQGEPVVMIENLTKWEKRRSIGIEGLYLTIQEGEQLLLYGNSRILYDLFRAICHIEKADYGKVKVNGKMACVPAEFPVWNELCVLDYMRIALEFGEEKEKEIFLQDTLWEKRRFKMHDLSEYEMQKLMLLMAFVLKPCILVIANIGKSFTEKEEKTLWDMVREYGSKNKMAVLCVSDSKEIPYRFDAIYKFLDGKLMKEEER